MPPKSLGLAGRNFASKSSVPNASRTMNLIPRMIQIDKYTTVAVLLPTPGLLTFVDLGTALPVRGLMTRSDGNLIAVSGTKVFSITPGGVVTQQTGAVSNTSNSHVEMFENLGGQVIIRADSNGYILSGTTVTQIASNFPANCLMVEFIDQYFLALDGGVGQQIYFSSINDGATWSATDKFIFDIAVETLVDIIVNRSEVFVLGSNQSLIYYNSGQLLNPFLRRPGGIIQYGCAAKNSSSKVGNDLFMVSSEASGSGIVVRIRGYEANKVSDYQLEAAMQSYGTYNDAIGFGMRHAGIDYYWLYFPSADATWVYDNFHETWHERGQWDGNSWHAHRAGCHVFFANNHIVGDISNGLLYYMDNAYTTDNGVRIRRLRQAPYPLLASPEFVYFNKVDIRFDVAAQTDNPSFILAMSDDEGDTFDIEYKMSVYSMANGRPSRSRQAVANRLGRSYQRVFQLITDDQINSITDSFIDASS